MGKDRKDSRGLGAGFPAKKLRAPHGSCEPFDTTLIARQRPGEWKWPASEPGSEERYRAIVETASEGRGVPVAGGRDLR